MNERVQFISPISVENCAKRLTQCCEQTSEWFHKDAQGMEVEIWDIEYGKVGFEICSANKIRVLGMLKATFAGKTEVLAEVNIGILSYVVNTLGVGMFVITGLFSCVGETIGNFGISVPADLAYKFLLLFIGAFIVGSALISIWLFWLYPLNRTATKLLYMVEEVLGG